MNRFKIIISLLIIFLFNIDYSYGETEILVISGETNFPPYEFVSEDGDYRGFNVDLMRALALELKREIKLIPMSWTDTYSSLNSGEIDAIQGMNFNNQRKEIYDFTDPYLINSTILFVESQNKKISNYDDLRGKRVAVQKSGTAAYILAEMGEIEVVFFSDLQDAFLKLKEGQVDAVFGDQLAGAYILKELNIKKDIKTLGDGLNRVNYGVAVKKGNEDLLADINLGLERIKRNGTYDKIFEKWFGENETKGWDDIKYYVYIVLGFILLSLTIVSLYIKWNKILKKEVNKRTEQLIILNDRLSKSKQLIKESDTFKQQIIDSLSVGLMTFDKNKEITDINKKAEEIFNLEKNNIIGRRFEDLGLYDFFDPKDICQCIDKGKAIEKEEVKYIKKGINRYFNYILSPIIIEGNIKKGGVATFKDITQERNIKKELIEKDKMHSLGRLITGIAHEIRNPLTSIKAYLEALPTKYDNPRFREKITDQVPKEINRLNELLKELLEYSKPRTIEKREFLLNTIILEVTNLLTTLLEEKDINLEINIEENVSIFGDKQRIKQVLINLLLNSIEAIKDKGELKISAYSEEMFTKIQIKDNGIGIEKEELDNIFEPFYTTKATGTGLGLLICYQHIKDNDGKINIISEKDVGTIVNITLNKNELGERNE